LSQPASERSSARPSLERLPLRVIVAYGAPSVAGAAMVIPLGIHLPDFYANVVLVPLGLIALVTAFARSFDALTDPVMGWISDRTRSRFGRRLPYIALGVPLTAVAFVSLFTPPVWLEATEAATWMAFWYAVYFIFHTVYVIPHYGLGPELTFDFHDRNRLFVWREAFVIFGIMGAAVVPPLLIKGSGSARDGYFGFAALFGALLVILFANLLVQIRERPEFSQREPNPLVPGVRRMWRNRAFRVLLFVYMVGSLTGQIPSLLMPFFTRYVIRPEDPDKWIGIFLGTFMVSALLALPFWLWLAQRYGKREAWLASYVPAVIAGIGLFFVGEGDYWTTLALLAIGGPNLSAGLFLGPSMQADTIDYDELHTAKRREAQYGGVWSILTKFAAIPSSSVPLAVLASLGFVPNVQQSETVTFALRVIFCLLPAATAVVAFGVGLYYPITRAAHEQILEGIERHKRGESALDPVTGWLLPPTRQRGVDENTGWFLDHFSLSELRTYVERGVGPLGLRCAAWAALALLILVGSLAVVANAVGDFATQPGLLASLGIVSAGFFGFTPLCFHAIRLLAVRRLAASPIPADVVRTHIASTEELLGGSPAPAGAGVPQQA
jgi:glycoside/pentoside/hexuronide:cation symporter, GPH family